MKDKTAIYLYDNTDERLFVFGCNCEIWVGKKGKKAACDQQKEPMFDLPKRKKALTGITGRNKNDMFDVKRIQVFIFK